MMLRLLEHYTSVQGEGPRTGTLTQFVRFAGCNLRCPGWPCDTPQAIFPDQYRSVFEKIDAANLADRIYTKAQHDAAYNVCITGGEPFIQNEVSLERLLQEMAACRLSVEVFTNGTVVIPGPWLAYAQINMDWKLTGSGEGQRDHDTRLINVKKLKPGDMVKFVVKDWEDVQEAEGVARALREDDLFLGDFWVGAAYGSMEPADLVKHLIDNGLDWKLNVQLHKYIWAPEATLV